MLSGSRTTWQVLGTLSEPEAPRPTAVVRRFLRLRQDDTPLVCTTREIATFGEYVISKCT